MTKLGRLKPRYSESFKSQIIKELLEQKSSIIELSKYYGVPSMTITRWIDKFTNGNNSISLEGQTHVELKKENQQEGSKEALEKRIEKLESMLEEEKLRSKAYKKMIEIAQKRFNISIEKKSGTKQSKR